MLKKLFKHEMQETGKLLLPLCLIVIAATILGAILIQTGIFANAHLTALPVVYMILYIFSIITLFILSAVYLMMRFYKTMYSAEGYLTHTLPVSPSAILNTKILSALIWLVFVCIICVFSVMTLIFSATNFPSLSELSEIKNAIAEVLDMPFAAAACLIIFGILIAYLSSILMVYACFAVGQLFGQYRIPAAIVAYIVFYIIQQIVSLIALFIFGMAAFDNQAIEQMPPSFYRSICLLGVTLFVLFATAYYITCQYITKKKLNLE